MQRSTAFALVLALTLALLPPRRADSATGKDRDLYQAAVKDYDLLKRAKPSSETRRRWEVLAERFEKIFREMPQSQYADDALLLAGKIHQELYRFDKKEKSLDLAMQNWRALLARYSRSALAKEARYRLALSYEEGKEDIAEARRQYQAIIEKYPKSDMAAKARIRLEGLRKAEEGKTARALLTQVRHTSSQSYTRVILELSAEARYEIGLLKEEPGRGLPARIYVDLLGTRLAMNASQPLVVQDSLLRQVRAAQFSQDVVRVVLDMNGPTEHRAFLLPDPYRLVVDIQGSKDGKGSARLEKRGEPPSARTPGKTPSQGLRRIVLDPGHGGKDPGAVGVQGLAEKNIVLSVAKKLARKLNRELGIEVVLTRENDSFIPLEDRAAVANTHEADLFISLHVNSSPNPHARGIETYYLDNTDDEASIRLAARENGTLRSSISDLQFILSDLTQNSKLEDSITLAHRLHSSLVSHMGQRYGGAKDLGVKKALFYVLVGAHMPSVLVELFFITNKVEGPALGRQSYQDAIVAALVEGIKRYQQSMLVVKNL